jgi:hypothetical protein
MMTWAEFNEAVVDLLLTDGIRRGRGVEKFRDRMIVAGVRDLQRNIPELRTTPALKVYAYGDLTTHSEGKSEVGDFDYESTRLLDIVVRRLPTDSNSQSASVYYRPKLLLTQDYYDIVDGGGRARTNSYPGRIAFNSGKFYSEPTLREDESLSILYNTEKNYKPINACTEAEKAEETRLNDDAALAVHHFVKYHFSKDIDDNQKLASSNFELFKNIRRSIFANRRELVATESPTIPEVGGAQVG